MMGSYGGYGMMGGLVGAWSILGQLTWIVVLIDLVLVGFWLWKQIQKK
ncbi:MAG: hypothetical protein UW69_C0040G0009 [Microgenomates group bacterium GW2011_GWA2_44_7]|nr:MAG: hypothetical protein UW69_C0040G0009 [Microgenomates group bacterium GW2011_GWA2_44_7]